MIERVVSTAFVYLAFWAVLPAGLLAEEPPTYLSSCEDVRVHIRAVEGTEPVKGNLFKAEDLKVDSRIDDLRPQLSKLHYASYKLLSDKSAVVPVTKRRVLNLANGHKLTLRPLYANDKRVGMWLKWSDAAGMEVIDSRVHFKCNENMLTGFETNPERGLILAIQVSPISVEND